MVQEIDAHFGAYEHLKEFPRQDEALHTLRKAASMVKPLMRKRGWRVGILCEFYPPENNLLGLNINQTARICVRLRYPHARDQFLPLEQVIDTLLHELSHIIHSPHNAAFHALWDQLRREMESLTSKGYTGEGFLSAGHKLGGRRVPIDELRRQARIAAEKRKTLSAGTGQRLGGTPILRGTDMRKVIADAVQRRTKITTGCASGTSRARELAEKAEKEGFRTKAEEDDANDRAIAQALMELFEEEELERLNSSRAETVQSGLSWSPEKGLEAISDPKGHKEQSAKQGQAPAAPQRPVTGLQSSGSGRYSSGRPVSRLVLEAEAKKQGSRSNPIDLSSDTANRTDPPYSPPTSASTSQQQPVMPVHGSLTHFGSEAYESALDVWSCPICTCDNPQSYLICDACGVERVIDSSTSASFGKTVNSQGTGLMIPQTSVAKQRSALGWNCRSCGSFMEAQWWTCSRCGVMKDRS